MKENKHKPRQKKWLLLIIASLFIGLFWILKEHQDCQFYKNAVGATLEDSWYQKCRFSWLGNTSTMTR